MKVEVVWNICRICLTENDDLQSIQSEGEDNMLLADKISICGGISVDFKMNLPQKICQRCLSILNIAYKFHTDCRNSDKILRSFLDLDVKDIFKKTDIRDSTGNKDYDTNTGNEYKLVFHINGNNLIAKPTAHIVPKEESGQSDQEGFSDLEIFNNEHEKETPSSIIDEKSSESCLINEESFKNILDTNLLCVKGKTPSAKKKKHIQGSNEIDETVNTIKKDDLPVVAESSESQLHICEVCGNTYKKLSALENHMRWHRDEKSFICEICGKSFAINFQLTRHMRSHTGQKPYKCKFCGRKFSDLSTNIKHERTHTNERPYKCDECGKSFNYSHVLKTHMSVHTGEKPYSCDLCEKSFSHRHHLKFHYTTLSHQTLAKNIPLQEKIYNSDELGVF